MSDQNSAAKESLSAYQRWEMASFDPVPPAPPEPEVDDGAFEAELERVRDAAHAQGIATGHVAGQALGYQAGYEQGHAQGFEQGQSEAREEAARLAALAETGVDPSTRVKDLNDDQLVALRDYLEANVQLEGDLRREVAADIRRKVEIGSYEGLRHRRGLPVRGQRTKTNARTRKGPKRTVAGKKKVGK